MKIYYYNAVGGDPRLPHESSAPLPPNLVQSLGLHTSHHPTLVSVDELAAERKYANRDEITISPEKMGDAFESKIGMFFQEHMHEDEEIRYILDGVGYFDVRSGKGHRGFEDEEKWVRIRMEKGDLIVLPAGIYHRFTVDEGNYIKAMRLFKDEPKWTALNRGPIVDENSCRKEYLAQEMQAPYGKQFSENKVTAPSNGNSSFSQG